MLPFSVTEFDDVCTQF